MILIFSSRHDVHADAAAAVLHRQGEECVIFRQEDFPQFHTVCIDPAAEIVISDKAGFTYALSSFRAVWNRRSTNPSAPQFLSPEDQDLSYRASKRFLEWLNLSKPTDQLWINDPRRAIEASSKITQLRTAREVGFSVPDTIITNQPDVARRFVAAGETIAKPILPMFWNSGSHRVATARLVSLEHLEADRAISACPMIYQRHIPKACDLRIVVFGAEIVAVRIESQREERSKIDFRAGDYFSLLVEEVDLDAATRDRILAFMAISGLLHASFDLVISANGEIVFLEVNQQGQMSWIEDRNPSIRILDRLCGFLMNPSAEYRWDGLEKFPFEQFRQLHGYDDTIAAS